MRWEEAEEGVEVVGGGEVPEGMEEDDMCVWFVRRWDGGEVMFW